MYIRTCTLKVHADSKIKVHVTHNNTLVQHTHVLVKAPLRVLHENYCKRGKVEMEIHVRGEAKYCIGIETVPQVQ